MSNNTKANPTSATTNTKGMVKKGSSSSSLLSIVAVFAVAVVAVIAWLLVGRSAVTTRPSPTISTKTSPSTTQSSSLGQEFRVIVEAKQAPEGAVVFGNALPDGSYPNVTGRRQILDWGVKEPRSVDGIIPFEIRARVPVEEWAPHRAVAKANIDRGTPLIMRGSVVSKWAAQGKWSPEYFANHVVEWRNISRARRLRRAFINFEYGTPYDDCTPWTFWENDESRQEYPMPIGEFFHNAANHSDPYFWAFAEEVPKSLLSDVSPRHTLKLKDQTWVYFSVWMGEGGACTAAHWDMDDNFYVQFYGRKRFLLFHPDTYKSWKSYPRASPNHKQVQMGRDNPSRYSYVLAPGAPTPVAYEAILYPGDMLYLPAYWYHHVEALMSAPGTTTLAGVPSTELEHYSISANFWSTSDMDFLVGLSAALPFDLGTLEGGGRWEGNAASIIDAFPKGYPREKIALATRLLLVSMVSEAEWGPKRVAAQAKYCAWLRYEDLFGPANAANARAVCPPALTDAQQAKVKAQLKDSAAAMIRGIKSLKVPSTAEIEFLNYLEMALIGAMPTKDLYDVISFCYAQTLGQDPEVGTGFKSGYSFDESQLALLKKAGKR